VNEFKVKCKKYKPNSAETKSMLQKYDFKTVLLILRAQNQ